MVPRMLPPCSTLPCCVTESDGGLQPCMLKAKTFWRCCSQPRPYGTVLPCLQVLSITVGVAAASWAAVYVAMLLLAPLLPMTRGRAPAEVRVIASLAGTVAIARSPASAVRLDSILLAQITFLLSHRHAQKHCPRAYGTVLQTLLSGPTVVSACRSRS